MGLDLISLVLWVLGFGFWWLFGSVRSGFGVDCGVILLWWFGFVASGVCGWCNAVLFGVVFRFSVWLRCGWLGCWVSVLVVCGWCWWVFVT